MLKIKGREVSEETVDLALQEYFKTHPENFESIHVCHITVSVVDTVAPIHIEGDCFQLLPEARQTIAAIQKAVDFVEKNKKQ